MSDFKFACPHCDQHLEAPPEMLGTAVDCPSCSKQIQVPKPVLESSHTPPQVGINGSVIAVFPSPATVVMRASRMARVSLVLGGLSVALSLYTAIPGIILGSIALFRINRSGGQLGGRLKAITGICLSGVGFLVLVVAGVAIWFCRTFPSFVDRNQAILIAFVVIVGLFVLIASLSLVVAVDRTDMEGGKLVVGKCAMCGLPSAQLHQTCVTGMLLLYQVQNVDDCFCLAHAREVYRKNQGHNLLLGWWSLNGLLRTPLHILNNVVEYRIHKILQSKIKE